LVDRVPLVAFLTKMAAVASEKTIRSSLPGMVLWLCEATLPPAGNRGSGAGRRLQSPPGTRRLLCWGGRAAAAEKVAGAPPLAGASRAPQGGHLFRKFGRGGWAAEGLWGYQGGQMGQNLPLCGQLGPTRSRQDESKGVCIGDR
jgi:hypothetical protein